jgi:hypothetical protein
MPPLPHAIVVPNSTETMPPTPSHASACPAATNTTVKASSLKPFAMLPNERVSLQPASLFTESLTPLATPLTPLASLFTESLTPPVTLAVTSSLSSTPGLEQQQLTPLSLTPAAPHLLPMVHQRSADTPEAAAAAARKRKHSAFASHRVPGLKLYAYAIESYCYVDKDVVDLMRALALAASSTLLAARPTLPPPHRQGGLLPLCVTGISTGRMPAICTLATLLYLPASRRMGTSAGP